MTVVRSMDLRAIFITLLLLGLGLGVALLPSIWLGAWFNWQHPSSKIWPKPHGIGSAEARMLQKFQDSMFNLFLMCSTIL
jgi:hypothetical protein